MNTYIGTKRISAVAMNRAAYNVYRSWELPADENGLDQGYLVEYLDSPTVNHPKHKGYISWSPKIELEDAYRKSGEFDFGMALYLIKLGKKIRLPYWAKDVFLELQVPDENSKMTSPYIFVTSRFGKVPWVATQIEMLSEKWEVVDG